MKEFNMNANLINNEWPEDYGIDLNPALAVRSVWEYPLLRGLFFALIVSAVLVLAAAEANALGSGQTYLLGMGWWEGLFDLSAGAYDAGGATIVGFWWGFTWGIGASYWYQSFLPIRISHIVNNGLNDY